jgi:hypothetical protein
VHVDCEGKACSVLFAVIGSFFRLVEARVCGCSVDVQEFTYLSLPILDEPTHSLTPSIEKACPFIQSAIESGGNVLVHW